MTGLEVLCVCVCLRMVRGCGGREKRWEMDGGGVLLILFNSIKVDLLACVEGDLLAYAQHTARGLT